MFRGMNSIRLENSFLHRVAVSHNSLRQVRNLASVENRLLIWLDIRMVMLWLSKLLFG